MSGQVLRVLAFAAGLGLVVLTLLSLLRTVIVPRLLASAVSTVVQRVVVTAFLLLARLRRGYAWRDGVRAWIGPVQILALLVTWLLLFLVGYGLMLYGTSRASLGAALRQSGSSMFTLGFAASATEEQTILDFFAAATGPIVIATMIGFLPTIYQAYVDREVDVTMLSARAGEPAWGPELLSRAALTGTVDELPDLYARWERWAAGVRLTHTTYPMLIQVRGPGPTRHWVVGLLAVLDAAALHVAVSRDRPPRTALNLVLQGSQTLDVLEAVARGGRQRRWISPCRIARRLSRPGDRQGPGPDPQADDHAAPAAPAAPARSPAALAGSPGGASPTEPDVRRAVVLAATEDTVRGLALHQDLSRRDLHPEASQITPGEFAEALDLLRRSGFPMSTLPPEAWGWFVGQRRRYERAAYSLGAILDAVPAPWSGPRQPPLPVYWPTRAALTVADGEAPDDEAGGGAG